jgi:uncharacterized protein YgiM (DUF1202 family)
MNFGVYDPYLYAGKFDIPGRAGNGTLSGTTYWIDVQTFKNAANAQAFFAFKAAGTAYDPIPAPSGGTKAGYVNTSSLALNVRSGPGTNYSVIATLPKGTNITIYDEQNGFCEIGSGKWVSSQYVAYGTNPGTSAGTAIMTVTAKSGLNVRSAPNTNASIVTAYAYGTKVQVYSILGGWAKVSKGYMSAAYLK